MSCFLHLNPTVAVNPESKHRLWFTINIWCLLDSRNPCPVLSPYTPPPDFLLHRLSQGNPPFHCTGLQQCAFGWVLSGATPEPTANPIGPLNVTIFIATSFQLIKTCGPRDTLLVALLFWSMENNCQHSTDQGSPPRSDAYCELPVSWCETLTSVLSLSWLVTISILIPEHTVIATLLS